MLFLRLQIGPTMPAIDRTKELETLKISKLLWMYALPSIVSHIIASIYNIVDRVFLGQYVGALAIAGLAITMPIMNIIHAFGSLVGAGSAARMTTTETTLLPMALRRLTRTAPSR